MTYVTIDFETASMCNLKKSGAWRYAECPTTEILCCSWSIDGGDPYTWYPDHHNPKFPDDCIFIAHNAQFEKAIWRRIMEPVFGWPAVPNSRWRCTLSVCAMRNIPQSLDDVAAILRLPQQKDSEGSRLTVSLSKPKKTGYYDRSPATLARVGAYCEQDVRTEDALHKHIGWLPQGELNVWLLDQRINERGIRLDMLYVAACKAIVDQASGPLLHEFSEITGGLKPTQVQKFIAWIEAQGASVPNLQKETLTRILGNAGVDEDETSDDWYDPGGFDVELPDTVRRALNIRQLVGSSSIKKLDSMELCVCADSRARGLLQYHGTGPGRWAGRLLQPQNFPRGTIKGLDDKAPPPETVVNAIMTRDPAHVEKVVGPAIETVVSGLRHSIVSDPKRVLLSGDYAGIQARVVLAFSGQHDKAQLMASGVNIYCDMGEQIYKRPIDKKTDPQEYVIAKCAVLGLGFQMGWRKFQFKYTQEHPDEFCKTVVDTYRKEWAPCVPKLWYGLERAAVRAVHERIPQEAYGVVYALEDGWLTARLPSGRKIWYFNPRPTRKAMPWDDTDVRPSFSFKARKQGRLVTIDAFGGLLTENVVMGMERDILVAGMFKCENNGMPIVLNVHDELVAEPLAADADMGAMKQMMLDVDPWVKAFQIPVDVDLWQGSRYRK